MVAIVSIFYVTLFCTSLGIHAVSSRAPIAIALSRDPRTAKALKTLNDHFTEIGNAVRRAPSCVRSKNTSWLGDAELAHYPGAAKLTTSCFNQIQIPRQDGKALWNSVDILQNALESSAQFIINSTGIGWKQLYTERVYNPFCNSCQFRFMSAIWDNGTWMLSINVYSSAWQTCHSRTSVLNEFVYKSGTAKASPILANGSIMTNATTTFRTKKLGDSGRPAQFYDIMWVTHATWRKYAMQTLEAANVAAMVVPLVLTLLPLALFVDASTCAGFVYALFTDVINVLPLALKGVELISLSSNPPHSIFTTTFGLDSSSKFGAASTWVLRCYHKQSLDYTGKIYLGLAFFAMCLGLYLEVRARRQLVTDKLARKLKLLNNDHRMLLGVCKHNCICIGHGIPCSWGRNCIYLSNQRRTWEQFSTVYSLKNAELYWWAH